MNFTKFLCLGFLLSVLYLPIFQTPSFSADFDLALMYTGEIHAALQQTETAEGYQGGLAQLTSAVNKIREKNQHSLLVDTGGFSAGGIYDQQTLGEELDLQRSLLTYQIMQTLSYDAICIGDEELANGLNWFKKYAAEYNLPVVSANITDLSGKLLFEPYRIVKKNEVRFALVGLTTPEVKEGLEALMLTDVIVTDPLKSLQQLLPEIQKQADVIVILAHLGQDLSSRVAKEISGIDLIFNGHRKISPAEMLYFEGIPLMQFYYQAQKLGVAKVSIQSNKAKSLVLEPFELSEKVQPDPKIKKIIDDFVIKVRDSSKVKEKFDLYLMSECPYGIKALKEIDKLPDQVKEKIELNLYYVISLTPDGRWRSLHGESEVMKDQLAIVVNLLVGTEAAKEFLICLEDETDAEGWKICAQELGLAAEEIEALRADPRVKAWLDSSLNREERFNITSSPTLFINNIKFEDPPVEPSLRKAICENFSKNGLTLQSAELSEICQNIPECITDADCHQEGKIARCENALTNYEKAHCVYSDDEKVELIVLYDSRAHFQTFQDLLKNFKELFPALSISKIDYATPEGKEIAKEYEINLIPAYLFANNLSKAHNFDRLKDSLFLKEDKYLLEADKANAKVNIARSYQPGKIDLILSSYNPKSYYILDALARITNGHAENLQIDIHYAIQKDDSGQYQATRGLGELEENLRQLIIYHDFPQKYFQYVLSKRVNPDTTYWEDSIKEIGLDPIAIKTKAKGKDGSTAGINGKDLLEKEFNFCKDISYYNDLVFLFDNRELAFIEAPKDLEEILNEILKDQKQ